MRVGTVIPAQPPTNEDIMAAIYDIETGNALTDRWAWNGNVRQNHF